MQTIESKECLKVHAGANVSYALDAAREYVPMCNEVDRFLAISYEEATRNETYYIFSNALIPQAEYLYGPKGRAVELYGAQFLLGFIKGVIVTALILFVPEIPLRIELYIR